MNDDVIVPTFVAPVAVIRGYPYDRVGGTGHDLITDPAKDLFR